MPLFSKSKHAVISQRCVSEGGVYLWKEGDMQGLSSTTCAPAAASLEVNSALPLVQAIALRMYSYCKMVLANPLWAEEESSFGTRKHTLIQPHPQKGLGWFKYLGCRKVTFVSSCTGIKYFFYKYWQETKIRGSSLWKWLALRTVFLWSQAFIHLISPVPIHHHTRTPSLSSLYCTCCWCRWGAETAWREAETYVLYGSLNSAKFLLSCFLRASFLPHFFLPVALHCPLHEAHHWPASQEFEGRRSDCGLFVAGEMDSTLSLIPKKPQVLSVFSADRVSCGWLPRGMLPALVRREWWWPGQVMPLVANKPWIMWGS